MKAQTRARKHGGGERGREGSNEGKAREERLL